MQTYTQKTNDLVEFFRKSTGHLRGMAEKSDAFWQPDLGDPRHLHNSYVKNLAAAYSSKFADLSEAILSAVDKEDYITYALCGRALIEASATLRYYVLHQYKPLFDKGSFSLDDYKSLLEIDDRHLRGGRFDWEAFGTQRYSKMKEDIVRFLEEKKNKNKSELKRAEIAKTITADQVNVITCVEKWAVEKPEVLIAYNLFSDLVHPNIGSNFLVASVSGGKIYFTKNKGELLGRQIFEQSFPILLAVAHKPFGGHLAMLLATCWQDDELN